MNMDLYHRFHERCFDLTGDSWCPYPTELFMLFIMVADDEISKKLIEKRRTLLFPAFLASIEPMWDDIKGIFDD